MQSPDTINVPQPDPPCTPRPFTPIRLLPLAVVGVLVSLAAVAGGFDNFSYLSVAILDYLTGVKIFPSLPPLLWAAWGIFFGCSLGFWLDAPLYGLRRHRWFFVVAPMVLLVASGVTVNSRNADKPWPADPAAPAPPPLPAPNFSGSWDTGRWGIMSLRQDGVHVFGTYTYADGVIEGSVLPGTSRLTYRWRNRDGDNNGVGYFDLAADANSFAGEWVEGERLVRRGQEWNGRRTAAAAPPKTFTGVWATEWGEMKLNQGIDTVTGTYEYGGGTIEGRISGDLLYFRWRNRVTDESGTGKFTLATYGESFAGSWNLSDNPEAAGEPWTGRRTADSTK